MADPRMAFSIKAVRCPCCHRIQLQAFNEAGALLAYAPIEPDEAAAFAQQIVAGVGGEVKYRGSPQPH
jgi:hypothetical protein